MRKFAILLIAGLTLASAKEQGMVVGPDRVWKGETGKDVKIRVCWSPAGSKVNIRDYHEKEDLGVHEVQFLKNEVQSAVEATWEKYGGIDFDFTAASACDIKIDIQEFDIASSNIGKMPYPITTTTVNLNLLMLRYIGKDFGNLETSARKRGSAAWITARAKAQANGKLDAVLRKHARYVAVHEFGHALGIFHEQSRAEAALVEDYLNNKNPNLEDTSSGAFPVGYYDPYSVMNYNSSSYGHTPDGIIEYIDRDGLAMPDMPRLSCGDLIAIRKLYPPTPAKAALIPCCTDGMYQSMLDKELYLRWSTYYANNKSCLEGKDIIIGNLAPISCTALAKQAAGGDVCKTPTVGTHRYYGDLTSCGTYHCNYILDERPSFVAEASTFWKNGAPWLKLKVKVQNLAYITGKRLSGIEFLFKSVGEKEYKKPAEFTFSGWFDSTIEMNEVILTTPLGSGPYDPIHACYCSYESEPPPGSYARYAPEKDMFFVDHGYTSTKLVYWVKYGQGTVYYKDKNHTIVDRTGSLFNLDGEAEFAIETEDEIRVGLWNGIKNNKTPTRPSITSLTTTDNGSGVISASWSPSSDADGDPIYYFVEVKPENATTFTKYKALGATSLTVTGLTRNTNYQVRISAFDTKERVFSESQNIQTPDKPETCTKDNTDRVLLANIPGTMVKRDIDLFDYRNVPAGSIGTNFFQYESDFCVEHSPNSFQFKVIKGLEDIQPSDWLYIESGDILQFDIKYKAAAGKSLNVVSPGTDVKNDYQVVGNLIKLSDYWGENAPLFKEWPATSKIDSILIKYKPNPTTRGTHRFGRIRILKVNPFGINFCGLRINANVLSSPPYDYVAYEGEPIEIELLNWYRNVNIGGSGLSGFTARDAGKSIYFQKAPSPQGLNTYSFSISNRRIPLLDNSNITFSLNVKPAPIFAGLIDERGQAVNFLVPGRLYNLDVQGLLQHPRKITTYFNGALIPLSFEKGRFGFRTPGKLPGKNIIQVYLNDIRLAEKKYPSTSLLPSILRFFE